MKIPSPQSLGFPEKYEKWRPNQEDAIRAMVTDTTKATTICATTGFGKTATYVAGSIISGEPTCIVTNSISLQDQIGKEFKKIGMVDIRGRGQYSCDYREDYTCQEGYSAQCPYKGTTACPASNAEMRAAISTLVVTNYDKWIAAKKYGQGMSHFTRVVFDEAHMAFSALAKAMQVVLNHHEVEEELEIPFLDSDQAHDIGLWRLWAAQAKDYVTAEAHIAYLKVTETSHPKPSWVKKLNHLQNLNRRLTLLTRARAEDWIVEELEDGYQFDPIRPARYAENNLFLRIPKIVAVSATLTPKSLYIIGMSKRDYTFHEYPSDFDPKDCPIYYVPTVRVDRHHPDLGALWVRHDQIAGRRRDRNGIVLPVSYDRGSQLYNSSRFRDSMMLGKRGQTPSQLIEDFRESRTGTILIHPAIGMGHDFPGPVCEWLMLSKVPFSDSRSKIVQAREEADPEFGPHIVAQTMTQNFGRHVRYRKDRGEGFICDDHMSYFYPRWKYLFPQDFRRRYKRVEVLPAPPPALRAS